MAANKAIRFGIYFHRSKDLVAVIKVSSEVEAYLAEPTLNTCLREITLALLEHKDKTAQQILGGIDAMKVKSSMTLFDAIAPDDIYAEVLNIFYRGDRCKRTLEYLQRT